ncbi:uncharacterized protein METZ01_LOCUS226600, partial [marine metagenome]
VIPYKKPAANKSPAPVVSTNLETGTGFISMTLSFTIINDPLPSSVIIARMFSDLA